MEQARDRPIRDRTYFDFVPLAGQLSPKIPAINHMIDRAGVFQSQFPRHMNAYS